MGFDAAPIKPGDHLDADDVRVLESTADITSTALRKKIFFFS